jgi:RNA polymerase sigma-70 factor (ECF subfamily)
VHDVFCRLPWLVVQYGTGGFGGWLKQITARVALMRLRAARSRRDDVPLEEWLDGVPGQATDADAMRVEDDGEVRRALAGLPESLREVVVLRVYLEDSHQEIARALGITVNASEVRLCRALKRLRLALRPDGRAVRRPRPVLRPAAREAAEPPAACRAS